ncbi:MAG: hypothetical protein Kow0058_18410 [Roseovarius sp.]
MAQWRNGAKPRLPTPAILAMPREGAKSAPDGGGIRTARTVAAMIAAARGPAAAPEAEAAFGTDCPPGWQVGFCRLGLVVHEPIRHGGMVAGAIMAFRAPRSSRETRCRCAVSRTGPPQTRAFGPPGHHPPRAAPTPALFAREAGIGRDRIVILVPDGAGWHGALRALPERIRPVHLPLHASELPPALTLRIDVDEPIVNRHFDTLAERDAGLAERCAALGNDRDLVRGQAGLHR